MKLHPIQFRGEIRRVLEQHWPKTHSKAAQELLMLTVATESNMGQFRRQRGGGSALGVFQPEPTTFNWLQHKFAREVPYLRGKVAEDLVMDDTLGILIARARYRVVPVALPSYDNVEALALYWKAFYNTVKGKGTVAKAIEKYHLYT